MKIDSYAVSSTAVSEYYSQSVKVAIVQNNAAGRSSLSVTYADSQTSMKTVSGSYEAYGRYEGAYLPAWADNPSSDEAKAKANGNGNGNGKANGNGNGNAYGVVNGNGNGNAYGVLGGKEKENGKGLLDISDEAKKKSDEMKGQNQNTKSAQVDQARKNQNIPSTKEELRMMMLERLLEYFGKQDYSSAWQRIRERLDSMKQGAASQGTGVDTAASGSESQVEGQDSSSQAQSGKQAGLTLQIKFYEAESTYEKQSMSYSSQGVVKTADGKEITFDVSLNMSSEHSSFRETGGDVSISLPLCDPLVINYAGTAASLTGEKFEFDLDFDGTMDSISFAGQGSGFLVLDKNGDGIINDGGEMFGPKTGSGFSELREYDKDANGWIDENDEVFSQLNVWAKDENGNDARFSLKDLDIGAIYLGDTKTEFAIKDATYNTQGVIRSSSVFLREDGSAGTIQHIDLAV